MLLFWLLEYDVSLDARRGAEIADGRYCEEQSKFWIYSLICDEAIPCYWGVSYFGDCFVALRHKAMLRSLQGRAMW